MADDNAPGGAGDKGPGGADPGQIPGQKPNEKPNGDPNHDPNEEPRTVPWKNHKRALDDMHRYKREAQEKDQKLAEIEDTRLREKEDWKKIAENKQAESEDWKQKFENQNSLFVNTQKFNAVSKIALEEGLLTESLEDLDLLSLEEVEIESTSSGRYVVHGAKEFIAKLKKSRPHWFKRVGAPKVDSGGGTITENKELTANDVLDAELKMKQGKITRDEYVATFNRFMEQRKNKRKE